MHGTEICVPVMLEVVSIHTGWECSHAYWMGMLACVLDGNVSLCTGWEC